MPTPAELIRVLLLPLVASAIVALIGRWRRWAWAMPVAAGVGFMAGFATVGVPALPPVDGTDWLFWLAIPAVGLGVIDALVGGRWGWLLGSAAATAGASGVAWVIVRPLVGAAVPMADAIISAAGFGAAALAVTATAHVVAPRLGGWAAGVAVSVVLGATAVMVMSSNLRVVGVYGIAAAAAVGPAAVLARGGLRGVVIVAVCLLAGLLAGGRFYADPGVTVVHAIVLVLAPLLLLAAAWLPLKKQWMRGVVGVALVAIAVAAVTVPAAIAAKRAAEEDPYGGAN